MTSTEKIKAGLRKKRIGSRQASDADFLNTGSTTLNLACSGRPDGGFMKGHYYFVCGDSRSGKTFLGLTCLAEASIDPSFDGYRFIHDDTEGGALMNIRRFFGQRTVERLEPPSVDDDDGSVCSETVEQFYFHLKDAVDDGRPFIYVLDSQDGLSSVAESNKFDDAKKAFEEGKDVSGSFGDGKPKVHSSRIRKFIKPLERSGSILIVLAQTRDSFDPFVKRAYSGGRALKFYATLQLWSSVKGKIERTVKGKKRELGVNCRVQVVKNRVQGKDRTVIVPIFHSVGIDDVGGCVDYLVDEGAWKKGSKGIIEATGIGPAFRGSREKLVGVIEGRDMVEDLRELVAFTWNEIESACEVKRKGRYG